MVWRYQPFTAGRFPQLLVGIVECPLRVLAELLQAAARILGRLFAGSLDLASFKLNGGPVWIRLNPDPTGRVAGNQENRNQHNNHHDEINDCIAAAVMISNCHDNLRREPENLSSQRG